MGEKPVGEKKMEETKPEELEAGKKPVASPEEEKKSEKKQEKPENTSDQKDLKEEAKEAEEKKKPQEIVLKVYMHCEGCARKVRRCLKGFEGVEDIMTDCKSGKVVVKGEKADPIKVLERIQRKSHRQVELLSPVPEPKPAGEPEKKPDEKKPKAEEKKEEVVTVVLRVHMHCEACAMEIQKRILRMKGVESAEPDFKASQVTVKGVFSSEKLVEYVYRRTGKHTAVVKQDPPPAPEKKDDSAAAAAAGDNKKGKDGSKDDKKPEGEPKAEAKEGGDGAKDGGSGGSEATSAADSAAVATTEETMKVVELIRNEYCYQPRYPLEMYAYPPQIFSDENPNACTVM